MPRHNMRGSRRTSQYGLLQSCSRREFNLYSQMFQFPSFDHRSGFPNGMPARFEKDTHTGRPLESPEFVAGCAPVQPHLSCIIPNKMGFVPSGSCEEIDEQSL